MYNISQYLSVSRSDRPGGWALYPLSSWSLEAPAEKQLHALWPLGDTFLPQHLSPSPAVFLEGGNTSSHNEVGEKQSHYTSANTVLFRSGMYLY